MRGLRLACLVSAASIAIMCSFSFAGEVDDVKAALARDNPTLSGEGAVITGPHSIEQIEKESLKRMAESKDAPQVPFGFDNARWLKFKALYKEGDIILFFTTNNQTWYDLAGREGYMLIRDKRVIRTYITRMN